MELKIKILKGGKSPVYTREGDSAMDLFIRDKETIGDSLFPDKIKYNLGIAVEIPENYVGLIFPRSSVYKKEALLTNCVGVIDSNYRGEISAVFKHMINSSFDIGERVAQMIIVPAPKIKVKIVEELSKSDRGKDAYGSSGSH